MTNLIIYVFGGLFVFLFIGTIMCLFVNSDRISEQEEKYQNGCDEICENCDNDCEFRE